jgi:alkylhydroperoxidase family enzyme
MASAPRPRVRPLRFIRSLLALRFSIRVPETLPMPAEPAIGPQVGPRAAPGLAPRIAPLEPPYPPEIAAAFDQVMRGAPPIVLFRTVARNPRVLQRMFAGSLLDRGSIPLRWRELAILRTCARCGAEYEWGVHISIYGGKAGWTPGQVAASVETPPGQAADVFDDDERLVLQLADSLHDTSDVNEALWQQLAARFTHEQLLELLLLCGLYHAVSFLANSLRLPPEPGAPRFPSRNESTAPTRG